MTTTEQEIYRLQEKIKKYKRRDDFYRSEQAEAELGVFVMENVHYVCCECGCKYGRSMEGVNTCHLGPCDVCGQNEVITAVRNFNYLRG